LTHARGLAASRSQAQRLIDAGVRRLTREGWKPVSKSEDLLEDAELELLDAAEARYVSRGGLKLEAALRSSGVTVHNKHCLDIGQSTGGFTDCLLQHGAAHVTGVDVGHGQLHARIRADARVRCIERFNAREIAIEQLVAINSIANSLIKSTADKQFDGFFDLLVGDVSFISQTLLIPRFSALLKSESDVLFLVKPQFELQPGDLSKGGLVKDASLYVQVEQRIRTAYVGAGFTVQCYFESPIVGGDGNREFFVHAVKENK
jgi:23S rRNA (cytidine1920-2'-O)/16S rRNA (cytidine1409-2'-O)-methyltransferase